MRERNRKKNIKERGKLAIDQRRSQKRKDEGKSDPKKKVALSLRGKEFSRRKGKKSRFLCPATVATKKKNKGDKNRTERQSKAGEHGKETGSGNDAREGGKFDRKLELYRIALVTL